MRKNFILFMLFSINLSLLAQNNEALNYIKQNAVPLDTLQADSGYLDLMPLKNLLYNRRIIGMGEATHGTHEFQLVKLRMLKFLVMELGYRLFGIEANFTECRKVNDYVLYGTGSARRAIGGTYFWTWKTKEVIQMVEWMHRYNFGKPDSAKVKFYGFDMQFDHGALTNIAAKLKKLDSIYYYAHFKVFDTLKICDNSKMGYRTFSVAKADSIKQLFANITGYINSQNSNLLKLYPPAEVAYLQHDVRELEQCLDLGMETNKLGMVGVRAYQIRDKAMAENIKWIMDYEGPQSKMMVWAHNDHIGKTGMGGHLKDIYKDCYYPIGFDFNKGSFRAVDYGPAHKGLITFTVGDAEPGSSGKVFSQFNIPAFFINVDSAVKSKSPAKSFFTHSIRQRSAGATFNDEKEKSFYLNMSFYELYDGLIFINATTPTAYMK